MIPMERFVLWLLLIPKLYHTVHGDPILFFRGVKIGKEEFSSHKKRNDKDSKNPILKYLKKSYATIRKN